MPMRRNLKPRRGKHPVNGIDAPIAVLAETLPDSGPADRPDTVDALGSLQSAGIERSQAQDATDLERLDERRSRPIESLPSEGPGASDTRVSGFVEPGVGGEPGLPLL